MTEFAYCSECHEWMRCLKNDVTVKYSENVYINGDAYICPFCNKTVVIRFGKPYTMNKAGEMIPYNE